MGVDDREVTRVGDARDAGRPADGEAVPSERIPVVTGPLRPEPFSRTSRKLVVAGLVLVGLYLLYRLRTLVSFALVSLLLAYALAPAVDQLSRATYRYVGRPLPRWMATLVVFACLAAALSLAGFLLLPLLAEQIGQLAGRLPQYYEQVSGVAGDVRRFFAQELPAEWRQTIESYLGQLGAVAVGFVRNSIAVLGSWLASAFGLVLIPIFTFFMILEAPGMRARILAWFPPRLKPEVDFLISEVNTIMFQFLRGRLLVAFLIAVLATLGNWLLGVPYALVLGVAAGLLDLLPFIGPIVAAIPAVVLALFESPALALWVIGLYTLIQQAENLILSPRIEGGELKLNPGVVIFAAAAAGALFGIIGVLLAIPITALARVVLLYLRAKLREEPLRPFREEEEA